MNPQYRLTAGITMVFNSKIFLGYTIHRKPNYWQMPQGGIKENEESNIAAKRELLEETGVNESCGTWGASTDWYTIDLPQEYLQSKRYINRKGQKYQWFLFNCHTKPNIVLSKDEFQNYMWVTPKQALDFNIYSFKTEMYRDVLIKFGLFNRLVE